ncbi:glycoside hydrolase superfamily [Crepidotus variabilis]|uniref:Beta-xylanase n=1 Tax=Crepidotus variabilis TaxID=179855 RepID=A0A9P6E4N2_9AGAR|nr:glycoside hydrolase superfamily [Crepidotus variabilis]
MSRLISLAFTAALLFQPCVVLSTPLSAEAATLNSKFQAHGKKFWGNVGDPNTFGNSGLVSVLAREFGAVTPEYTMKWETTEPSRGSYNFAPADQLVNWAVSNGKLIRGHTFVWHSSLPSWVQGINDHDTLLNVVANHVGALSGYFKGKLYVKSAWDVVNEVLNDDGSLRDSVFSRVLGESFISLAFKVCRDVDPNVIRYINDYGLEWDNAKTRAIVALVNRINAADGSQMIQGIGSQMHLEAGKAGGALAAMQILASANVREIAITELDIEYASPDDYKLVMNSCLGVPKCVSITSWGVSDPYSWRAAYTPLLFDGNNNPKAAYNALMAAL